ncbi:MAG: hypothetical protein KC583_18820 [Myxococcales bacterium]|nr:hypothetical protein [Myxococcales bacterium]
MILALVVTQSLALAGLVYWWIQRTPDAPRNQDAFDQLMRVVRRDGAAAAVQALGEDVVRAGLEACHREACIADIFNGDEARWRAVVDGSGVDRCAGYAHPNCTRTRVVQSLTRVLRDAHLLGCAEAGRAPGPGGEVRLRVACKDVTEQVRLTLGGDDRFILLGEPRFPGFLPRVFARRAQDPAEPR